MEALRGDMEISDLLDYAMRLVMNEGGREKRSNGSKQMTVLKPFYYDGGSIS
jgi:hypothetical protein